MRNRLKRHLREAIRSVYPNITYGIDLIAIARAPMVEAGVADITTALIEVLHRAGVWRESSAGSNEA